MSDNKKQNESGALAAEEAKTRESNGRPTAHPAPAPLPTLGLDAFIPPEMAKKAEDVGVTKATMGPRNTFVLSILAGSFIGLGAVFATTVAAGAAGEMSYGVTRLLTGLVFCLGLILVVVAGAELFTGNNLIVMAWADNRVSTLQVLRNWVIVYAGNFAGSVGTAILVFLGGQYTFGGGLVGLTALNIAHAKCNLGFLQAIALGIMCNALVCLAVWLCLSCRTTTDKVLAILLPISAFVAAGFEHSVANMYFMPMALFIQTDAAFMRSAALEGLTFGDLTWANFIFRNLIPVTLGNIIGGSFFVGIVYWLVYCRQNPKPPAGDAAS